MTMQTNDTLGEFNESIVSCQDAQGNELRLPLLKLTHFQAVFQIASPVNAFRLSEVLRDFRILIRDRSIYSGRAVVSNCVDLGPMFVVEATLDTACFDPTMRHPLDDAASLNAAFLEFIQAWGRNSLIRPEFKILTSDLQSLFADLRLWMEQVELRVRSQPTGDGSKMEREILQGVEAPVLRAVGPLLDKFEELANSLEPAVRPAHQAYMKRQIHPVFLCSPFDFRAFQKPLGYAGDYEMVNMMLRDPFEGASTYAKLANRISLNTAPVIAHRDRISYLTRCLITEAGAAAVRGQAFHVFNVGCGPAKEIQDFLAQTELSNHARITLLDFNEETLAYTERILRQVKERHCRSTWSEFIKKTVHHLVKDASRTVMAPKYELIYCAGLFDYLPDQVCRRLMNLFYELVLPGGLVVATNVSTFNPSRNWMEYVLDWHLIYRSAEEFATLAPERAPADAASVVAIGDGVNMALEVRKPAHAG